MDDRNVPSASNEIRVVSFDLDNTLWKTGAVISEANEKLALFLEEHHVKQPIRAEKIMGQLFLANKTRYSPVLGQDAKGPVCLTLLRKDAIQKLMQEYNGYSEKDAIDFSDRAFQIWTDARHQAIPHNYACSVLETMQEVASISSQERGKPVLIAGITDGNSDPLSVPGLGKFFDFCVNAESVGATKPHTKGYLEAARRALSHPKLSDLVLDDPTTIDPDALKAMIGPYWVHVGDDFSKDIVAAKSLNMRTVWARELILDKLNVEKSATVSTDSYDKDNDVYQTSNVPAGSTDSCDAIIDTFSDLGGVLKRWHNRDA